MKAEDVFRIVRFDVQIHLNLIETMTFLLHEAYAPLALRGMKYLATHQPAEATLKRLEDGEAYLGFLNKELIGTVTLYSEKVTSACEYYKKTGVFSFGQFAVKLNHQGFGYGSLMMDFIENRAKELGALELALDTSEHADDLIRMYEKRGYRFVAHTHSGKLLITVLWL